MTTYHSTQDKQSSNTEESSQDAAPCPVSPSEVPADDREPLNWNCNRCWIPTTREYPLEIRKNTIIKSYCHDIGLRKLGAFVVLLVSQFFAIPGFNNRGKSFLGLDLALVSLFINLTTNWFFAVPAYYERILGYITFGLLLIDFIVALLVSPIRQSLGFWIYR